MALRGQQLRAAGDDATDSRLAQGQVQDEPVHDLLAAALVKGDENHHAASQRQTPGHQVVQDQLWHRQSTTKRTYHVTARPAMERKPQSKDRTSLAINFFVDATTAVVTKLLALVRTSGIVD
jgi:hypothetical protein